eukprot:CAMPEP_0170183652 /NCGR_PEP_ID=MMETSP0040_2-20121228/31348_1 /TAXON_ID=641309 /ORGANISM="Lotharella oceanica, Strain CCMP622" /LENGTH=702 /DNA_ID=CAMNT_0010429465 /DNA_START=1 /DNA_END=2109 /DNA_ORIENTATION=+
MFTASGMLSLAREKKSLESRSSFMAICGIACLSTLVAIAVSAKFFLPSYISLAYAICVFLVPLTYRALGSGWVRFCDTLISSRCQSEATRSTQRNSSFWSWFILLQILLVLAFWSATLISSHGYIISESFSLLVSFGCFNALCVAVMVTHGVGGRLKHASYRFYQPFEGGMAFCILQGLGWALFSLSLFFLLLHFLVTSANLLQFCGQCVLQAQLGRSSILVGASSTGVVSEILMVISLLVFHDDEIPKKTLSKIRRAFSSPSLAALAVDDIHHDRRECASSRNSLRRSPSSPTVSRMKTKTFILPPVKNPDHIRPRAMENWAFPIQEVIEATEDVIDEGKSRIRGLDNWGVDVPAACDTFTAFSGTSFRFVQVILIAVAVIHKMVKSAALSSLPGWVIPAISMTVCGSLLLISVITERRVLRPSRRRRRRGLGCWDSLDDSEEVHPSAAAAQKQSKLTKKGLNLWDRLYNVNEMPIDHMARSVRISGRGKRGLSLWGDAIEVEEPNGKKQVRKRTRGVELWDYLNEHTNTPDTRDAPKGGDVWHKRVKFEPIRVSSKLSSWDFIEDVLPLGAVETATPKPRSKQLRGLDNWDCFANVNPAPKEKRPRQRRGIDNWDCLDSVDLPCETQPNTPAKDRRGVSTWNMYKGLETESVSKERRKRGERQGLSSWDFLVDAPLLSCTNGLNRRTSRGIQCWDFLHDA